MYLLRMFLRWRDGWYIQWSYSSCKRHSPPSSSSPCPSSSWVTSTGRLKALPPTHPSSPLIPVVCSSCQTLDLTFSPRWLSVAQPTRRVLNLCPWWCSYCCHRGSIADHEEVTLETDNNNKDWDSLGCSVRLSLWSLCKRRSTPPNGWLSDGPAGWTRYPFITFTGALMCSYVTCTYLYMSFFFCI